MEGHQLDRVAGSGHDPPSWQFPRSRVGPQGTSSASTIANRPIGRAINGRAALGSTPRHFFIVEVGGVRLCSETLGVYERASEGQKPGRPCFTGETVGLLVICARRPLEPDRGELGELHYPCGCLSRPARCSERCRRVQRRRHVRRLLEVAVHNGRIRRRDHARHTRQVVGTQGFRVSAGGSGLGAPRSSGFPVLVSGSPTAGGGGGGGGGGDEGRGFCSVISRSGSRVPTGYSRRQPRLRPPGR
jgi:hypothetical protein